MSGRIGFWGPSLVSLAAAIVSAGHALAQPAAAPAEPPQPEVAELPSETPPPPPLPPEPPPESAPVAEAQPFASPLGPVVAVTQDGEAPAMDITLPISVASLALGGAFLLSGGITLGVQPSAEQYCTVSGCVDRAADRDLTNIGADLLGAGAGFALVGGIGMLAWLGSRPTGTEQRHSVPMLGAGFSMTAFGAAGFGLGLAQTLTYKRDEAELSTSWPLFVTSGLLLVGGIPLWTAGANNRDARERAEIAEHERRLADPRIPKQRRSTSMVVGGSILTGLGGLGGLAGTVILIADTIGGGPSFLFAIVGAPTLGVGGLCTGIGVPMIVSGNEQVIAGDDAAAWYLPDVTVGGSGLNASWRLD